MTDACRFNESTKEYLTNFYAILDNMIKEMETAELTDSISHNFIAQMIPHHRAAIEMSKNILRYTCCVPLRVIAQNIIDMQTRSIQNMLEVNNRCSMLQNPGADLCLYQRRFQQIVHTMFEGMDTACADNNISNTFMREMIPHHMGAIRMSENALRYDICSGLQPILNAIIVSQRQGICEMEQLLGKAYSPATVR